MGEGRRGAGLAERTRARDRGVEAMCVPQLRGFLRLVAELGVPIVSGGALGVDDGPRGRARGGRALRRCRRARARAREALGEPSGVHADRLRRGGAERVARHGADSEGRVCAPKHAHRGAGERSPGCPQLRDRRRDAHRAGSQTPRRACSGHPRTAVGRFAEGANELIRGGATLCATLADVREAMGISGQGGLSLKRPAICLDATQRSVVDAVAAGHVTVEALCRATELTAAALQEQLLLLTLDGALVDGPRGYEVTPRVRSSALGFD